MDLKKIINRIQNKENKHGHTFTLDDEIVEQFGKVVKEINDKKSAKAKKLSKSSLLEELMIDCIQTHERMKKSE